MPKIINILQSLTSFLSSLATFSCPPKISTNLNQNKLFSRFFFFKNQEMELDGALANFDQFLTMWYNTSIQQLQSAFFLGGGSHSRRSPIQVLTVPMLLHFCAQIEGTGVSTSLGRWLWNLVCFVWSDNLVRTLMWYE
jgi:hypothetical protein